MNRLAAALVIALVVPTTLQAQPLRCAPDVTIDSSVPPRLVARLRALAGRVAVPGRRCPSVEFAWSAQRLSVHIALEDGRVARRTLRSLDDALPTLLAVLAAPPEEDESDDAEAQEEPDAPPPEPVNVAASVSAPPPARVARASAVTARAQTFALSLQLGYGGAPAAYGFTIWRAELGLVRPSWALVLRGSHADGDRHEGGRREDAVVAAMRLRWGVARWRFEFGGGVGLAWRRVERERQRDPSSLAARIELEGVAAFRVWRTFSVVAWAEAWSDFDMSESAGWQDDPTLVSFGGGAGLRWEVP
jgi:hypothetical protein